MGLTYKPGQSALFAANFTGGKGLAVAIGPPFGVLHFARLEISPSSEASLRILIHCRSAIGL